MKLRYKLGLVLVGFLAAISLLTFQTLLVIEAHRDLTSQLGQLNSSQALLELAWDELARAAASEDPELLSDELDRFRVSARRAGRLSGNRSVSRQLATGLEPLLEGLRPAADGESGVDAAARVSELRGQVRGQLDAAGEP